MPQLVNNERSPYTDVVKITVDDLKAIGTGGTRRIATIPAGGAVELCTVIETVAVVGSSTLVIDIGTTIADPEEFINALDVDAMTTGLPTFNTGTSFVQTAGNTTIKGGVLPVGAASAATPVYIKVTDAAVASITAGEIMIGFRILDLTKFA
jgi:cytosine/uracil/thiamine/allantoin permease